MASGPTTVLTCILFSCIFGQFLNVSGFQQELWLYLDEDHQGDHRWFQFSQPNLTYYSELLPFVKSVCFTGVWQLYSKQNFKNELVSLGSFETASEVQTCELINGSDIKSLRLMGSSDTEDLGLNLFTKHGYIGNVFSVYGEDEAIFHVNETVRSLAASGYDSSYLLFEGESFEGNYSCIPVPKIGYQFNWVNNIKSRLGIDTVGSAIGGRFCPNGVQVENLEFLVEELRQKYRKMD